MVPAGTAPHSSLPMDPVGPVPHSNLPMGPVGPVPHSSHSTDPTGPAPYTGEWATELQVVVTWQWQLVLPCLWGHRGH